LLKSQGQVPSQAEKLNYTQESPKIYYPGEEKLYEPKKEV